MGTDCYIKLKDKIIQLDRWYIFNPPFEGEKKYDSVLALAMIKRLKKKIRNQKPKPTWGNGTNRTPYFTYWYDLVSKEIKKSKANVVIFFDEHSAMADQMFRDKLDEFYNWLQEREKQKQKEEEWRVKSN